MNTFTNTHNSVLLIVKVMLGMITLMTPGTVVQAQQPGGNPLCPLNQPNCGPGQQGDNCDSDLDCAFNHFCAFNGFTHKCKAQHSEDGGLHGNGCVRNRDCVQGQYCQLMQCFDGSEGDRCGSTPDCQTGLSCHYPFTSVVDGSGTCIEPKAAGGSCTADDNCVGYCHNLACRSGSKGDPCGKDSDCQDDLTCIGTAGFAKCTNKKRHGLACGSDDDCVGYCQFLKCRDGRKGDKCRHSTQCQGDLKCQKRCRICAQKICK